jgi:hypothetical protein
MSPIFRDTLQTTVDGLGSQLTAMAEFEVQILKRCTLSLKVDRNIGVYRD